MGHINIISRHPNVHHRYIESIAGTGKASYVHAHNRVLELSRAGWTEIKIEEIPEDRRTEWYTSSPANTLVLQDWEKQVQEAKDTLTTIAAALGCTPGEVVARVTQAIEIVDSLCHIGQTPRLQSEDHDVDELIRGAIALRGLAVMTPEAWSVAQRAPAAPHEGVSDG